METKHTPGPFTISDTDGRHKRVAILTDAPEFADEDAQPYHPLVGVVYYGGQHAPREVAQATARLFAASPDLEEAVERLILAADERDIVMGDPSSLIVAKANLREAAAQGRIALAKARGLS